VKRDRDATDSLDVMTRLVEPLSLRLQQKHGMRLLKKPRHGGIVIAMLFINGELL